MSLREGELNIFTPKIYIVRLESTPIKTIVNLFFIHYSLATHDINYECTYGLKKKLVCIRSVYPMETQLILLYFKGA